TILRVVGRVLRAGPVARIVRLATSEIAAFNTLVVRFLHRVDERLVRLDTTVRPPPDAVSAEVAHIEVRPLRSTTTAGLVELLGATGGRVLHAGCGHGELVAALTAAGRPAYGVDPRRALHVAGLRDGLDLRGDEPATHLASL